MAKWHYFGDVDLEGGGTFVRFDDRTWNSDGEDHGYFDACRVTPCSEAGGPDNVWWVECLTGIVSPKRIREAFSVMTLEPPTKAQLRTIRGRRLAADALIMHGDYDPANTFPEPEKETVQIGKETGVFRPEFDPVRPTVVLRANANLRRWVRANMLPRM